MRPRSQISRPAVWTFGSYRVERLAPDFWVLTRGSEIIETAATARQLIRRAGTRKGARLHKTLIALSVFLVSITVLVSGSMIESWPGAVCVIAASLTTCASAIRLSEQFVPRQTRRRSIV